MLLLPSAELPEGDKWLIELKLDGFRAIAFKAGGKVHLRSRNDKDFNSRYPVLVRALGGMPDETVIDGEVVAALDLDGRPSFSALQNFGSALMENLMKLKFGALTKSLFVSKERLP